MELYTTYLPRYKSAKLGGATPQNYTYRWAPIFLPRLEITQNPK